MRIALIASEFITEHSFTGGLANYMYRLAHMLKGFGHDVIVITSSGTTDRVVFEGINVHRIQVKDHTGWHIPNHWLKLDALFRYRYNMSIHTVWQSWKLNAAVRKIHKEEPIDVLQYAHLEAVGLFKPTRIPAVIRLSSSTRLCQESGGYGTPEFSIRQQEFLERLALRRANAIFGPSHQIAKYVHNEIGKEVGVIESPFFYDVEQEDDSVYQSHLSGKTYLLFFGSIGLIKGAGTIAQIIHSLLSRHSNLNFVFVGKRLQRQEGGDLMDQIWHNAAQHKNRVLYFEPLRHEKLYPIIRNAHTVVLPSRIDNFPNACIEAMAHGKVVIGTRGNGFEQLIDHGKNGFLCTPDDPNSLLRTIDLALMLTDEERLKIGKQAAIRIDDLHPEKVGKQLVELYKSVMS